MFLFLGTILGGGRAQSLDAPPRRPWSLLRTERWLLQVESQKALITANSRRPRFIRAHTASREATEISCAQCPQLYCPSHVQKCALFCDVCILCYSAPGQWWVWCKSDPSCLAGIFLDMNSDIWKENPVNGSWRKAFWPGRGSHQMARRCHEEAGASKGAGGAGHWSGTGAACWVFYKQREIFVGLFYIAKENRKVGRLDWEDITGFLLILISGQNLVSSSRVSRAGKIRWLGKRWSFWGFWFWFWFFF